MTAVTEIDAEPTALDLLSMLRESPSIETIRGVIACNDALDILAQDHHDNEGTSEAWFIALRGTHGMAKHVDRLRAMVVHKAKNLKKRSKIHAVDPSDSGQLPVVTDILAEAPISRSALVPAGYRLSEFAVFAEYVDKRTELPAYKEIAPAPVLITERHIDVETHRESVTLAWFRDDAWQTHICDRDEVMMAPKLAALSAIGLPVTTGTAKDLVDYLAKFDATNQDIVERSRVSERFGWHEVAGIPQFLWGTNSIAPSVSSAHETDIASRDENGTDR